MEQHPNMIQDYPKAVYKTRQDSKVAQNLEDEERLLKEGYGDADIMLSGNKPKAIKEADKVVIEVKAPVEAKKRTRRTRAQMAALRENGNSK